MNFKAIAKISLLLSAFVFLHSCEDEPIEIETPLTDEVCWDVEEGDLYLNWEDVEDIGPFIVNIYLNGHYHHTGLLESIETTEKEFTSTKFYFKKKYYYRIANKNGLTLKEGIIDFNYNDIRELAGDYRISRIDSVADGNYMPPLDSIVNLAVGIDDYAQFTFSGHYYFESYLPYEDMITSDSKIEFKGVYFAGLPSSISEYRVPIIFDEKNCEIDFTGEEGTRFILEKI